jgi:hypothetical protein
MGEDEKLGEYKKGAVIQVLREFKGDHDLQNEHANARWVKLNDSKGKVLMDRS